MPEISIEKHPLNAKKIKELQRNAKKCRKMLVLIEYSYMFFVPFNKILPKINLLKCAKSG